MNAHKPQLDQMTPAEIRVICEYLLYTMDIEQRAKLKNAYPGLYQRLIQGPGGLTPSFSTATKDSQPECAVVFDATGHGLS